MSVQALVALATWVLKRPTAIRWSREESIVGHHKRHPFFITAKWGAKRDGTIAAVATTLSPTAVRTRRPAIEVLKGAMTFAHGPYEIANVATTARLLHQQRARGAFRGFGGPQAHFAAESMVDTRRARLGIDPLDLRRANLYREGSINSIRQP